MINLDLKNLSNLEGPILVTGHTGFKGTWLTFLLEELGLSVIGISKEPLKDSLYELANRKAKIPEIYSDLHKRAEAECHIPSRGSSPGFGII